MRVFVDTSAWLAFISEADQHHRSIAESVAALSAEDSIFYTSNDVVDETVTRLAYDVSVASAEGFYKRILQGIDEGWLIQIWCDEAVQKDAVKLLAKYKDKELSLTDATSAVLMKSERIKAILTLDSDFEYLRFQVLH